MEGRMRVAGSTYIIDKKYKDKEGDEFKGLRINFANMGFTGKYFKYSQTCVNNHL
jgi:hypothetical protein